MAIRTLLIGTYTEAPYHPLGAIEDRLLEILKDTAEVTSAEGTGLLRRETLEPYELCISYTDSWNQAPAAEETAGLLQFVAGGGGLLVIHNGISLQASPELCQLIGAKFTGHPPYTTLPFQLADSGHPLTEGLEAFTMDEEPYRFELDPLAEITVLLTYEHEGQEWPAAWVRNYGLGRVVFLMPGHHRPSFEREAYGRWIVNAAKWAAERL
ncbi:ThuA domain-containing protein ['Paenibacillus yunnanensis' Narsing Rao et al. 2020]|uniref:ThuA domain-containing protein n=1 Tax=Paenibacillus tengchongensis TaxID=2608684 RepID=UPI00124EABEF|nr:ThuA domain-containing protein [Paenibacillus tengchongensis]